MIVINGVVAWPTDNRHNIAMDRYLDLRFLWGLGAIMLFFCSVGLLVVAALVGLPLSLIAIILDIRQENVLTWMAYASPLWAPIGAGMGMVVTGTLVKGVRRRDPTEGQ